MRISIITLLVLAFAFQNVNAQTCMADAGTSSVTYPGGGPNPFVICYGDSVGIVNNGDYVLPPPGTPGPAALYWAIFDCAPMNPFDEADPCWRGAWTGENFQVENDEGGVVPFLGGINTFWIAALTVDNATIGGFLVDQNNDMCFDANMDQVYQITFLFEMDFTHSVDVCTGTVTINISGGYPQDFPGMYMVNNTGPGTLTQSGASGEIITISGLNHGDSYSIEVTDDGNGCSSSFSGGPIFLSSDDPSFTFDSFCVGESNGPSNIADPGGSFAFNPNPGDGATINPSTGEISNPVSGATYTVEYTTNGMCPASSTVNVTVMDTPPAPTVNPASYTICPGEVVSVTPSGTGGTLNYYNNPPPGTPIATGNSFNPAPFSVPGATTTFYVTETIGSCEGPAATFDVDLINLTPPTLSPDNATVCEGDMVTISPTGNNGVGTPVFNFYNDSGLNVLLHSGSSMTLTATSSIQIWVTEDHLGCDSQPTVFTITVDTAPAAPAISDVLICLNDNVPNLTASGSGGTINWYNSDPSVGNPSPIATNNPFTPPVNTAIAGVTTFWVAEMNATGCEGLATSFNVTVDPGTAPPSASSPAPICAGDPVPQLTASGSGGTINWYNTDPTNGNPAPIGFGSPFTPVLDTNTPGGYNYWVTEANSNNCSGLPSLVTITINDGPATPLVSDPDPVCLNSIPPQLIASGSGGTLLWYDVDPSTGNPTPIGTGSPFLPPTNTNVQGSTNYWVTTTNGLGCESQPAMVIVTVNATPNAPNSDPLVQICVDDAAPSLTASGSGGIFTWYFSDPDSGPTAPIGTGSPFSAPVNTTAPGSVFLWVTDSDVAGCESPSTLVNVVINPLPTIVDIQASCNADLVTYTVDITLNNADNITVNEGSITDNGGGNFIITGINVANNLLITASDQTTGCEADIEVPAPDCDCPTVNNPIGSGDVQICEGEAIPALTMNVGAGETVDWYDALTGGNLLLSGSTSFTPTTGGTYFAETRVINNGCTSASRTAVTLTITPLPQLTDFDATCSADLTTYTLTLTLANADGISVPEGTVVDNGGGSFTVSGIDINNDITVTASDLASGCSESFDIMAPACNCPDIEVPVSDGDIAICEGETIPALSVTTGVGLTADWYDAATGGTLLASDTLSFTPTGSGTFFVEARDTVTSCVSSTRTEISLTINPLPAILDSQTDCAADLNSYTVSISFSNADTVLISEGMLTVNGGGSFTISEIDINNDLLITAQNNSTSCSDDFTITAPDCSCPGVNAPVSGGDEAICEGEAIPDLNVTVGDGQTADWYDADTGGLLLLANSTTFSPTVAGTYFAETRDTLTDCISSTRTGLTLTIFPLPATTDIQIDCAMDLLTYSVTVLITDADNVSASSGMVTDNGGGSFTIANIDVNNDLTITASNTVTSCSNDFLITAPDCNCPGVNAPVSNGDVVICEGEVIPALSVTVDAGMTVDWYDAATGGNLLLANSVTFTPTGAGSYFAETREIATDCLGPARAEVLLTINPLPTMTDSQADCAPDLLTYTVSVNFDDADNITVSEGMVTVNGGGSFTITGVVTNNDLVITANNTVTGCQDDFTITAPDCSCPVVDAPVNDGDIAICEGDAIPALTVSVADGETVDWYDAATGGNLLLADATSFTPTDAGTFFAETRVIVNGCLSATRTSVTLTINPLPTLINSMEDCAPDLLTYSTTVSFNDADGITVSEGMVTDNGGGSFTISGITVNTDLQITASNSSTGCQEDFTITAPDCSCPVVDAPVNDGDLTICDSEVIPSLSVTVNTGETVDWYDAATGGTLLLSGNNVFEPTGAGTFFAETRVIVNGCISSVRTPVTLTINPSPVLTDSPTSCAPDLLTYSVTLTFTDTDGITVSEGAITDNGGGSFTVTGIDVNNDLSLTASNSVTSCSADFTVTAPDCPCPIVNTPTSDGDQAICDGDVIPDLSVTVGAGETVDWYDAATGGTLLLSDSPVFTPTMAGTYYAETRMLINNCVSDTRVAVSLIINSLPGLIVSEAIDPGCGMENGSITVQGTGGQNPYMYQINGQGFVNNGTFSGLAADTYSFMVQDDNGCLGAIDTTIFAPVGVTAIANVTDTLTCTTTSVSIDGNLTTSDGPVTYEWIFNNGTISNEISTNVEEPGMYILNAYQDACSDADTIFVVQNLSPGLMASITTENMLDCNITSAPLDGTASSSGANITYQWYINEDIIPGATNNTYNAMVEGTYELIVTDTETGCTATATFELLNNESYPVANAGEDGVLNCQTSSVFADGSNSQSGNNIVYQWYDGAGNPINGATFDTLTVFAAGTYTLMVEDVSNGCANDDSMIVTTDFVPPVAQAGNPTTLDCDQSTLSLNGQGSSVGGQFSYEWTTDIPGTGSILSGSNTLTPLIGGPGTYYLRVINSDNGCESSDFTTVTQLDAIPTNFSVLAEDAICYGETNGFIGITPADQGLQILYSFNNEPFTSTTQYPNLGAGSYTLTAEDANGCQWDTTIVLQEGIEMQIDLGEDDHILLGESVHLDPIINFPEDSIASIDWTNQDLLLCPDCLDPLTTALVNTTTFLLTITDNNGCTAFDDITIFVDKNRRVYIPNAFSPNADGINDMFMIYSGSDVANVKRFFVFDRWGEAVLERFNFNTNDPDFGWNGTYRGRSLNPGVFVYMAEIEFVDGQVEIFSGEVMLTK